MRHDIKRLYHGAIRDEKGDYAIVDFPDEEGVHVYTIPLIKDTNDINVVLQHISGDPVDKDEFTMTVVDANGKMNWDNSILPDDPITYYAHHKYSGTAGMVEPDPASRTITSYSACIGEFTVARLMEDRDMRLIIRNRKNEEVVNIPMIDYALLVKSSHNVGMTDQEFLDRQDKYDLVFFLDRGGRWVYASINIASWKKVIQNTEL